MSSGRENKISHARGNGEQQENTKRQKRKLAFRARHRLLSIQRDSEFLQAHILSALKKTEIQWRKHEDWPWIPNKQCGSWYLPPTSTSVSSCCCYFKSTDGHVGTYALSLMRLNLPLIEVLHRHGGCYLVDSSVRKSLPDSFSRTIPIWACVMNRIVQKYRQEGISSGLRKMENDNDHIWDTKLHTPASIVSVDEHRQISELIDDRVEFLYKSKAIVDPKRLVDLMSKPLRPTWISNGRTHKDTIEDDGIDKDDIFFTIVCCNPSFFPENEVGDAETHAEMKTKKRSVEWRTDGGAEDRSGYYYTPGAADDQESWARQLTPELFWKHKDQLTNRSFSEDEIDGLIDNLVKMERQGQQHHDIEPLSKFDNSRHDDKIGSLNLWIGSRRSGRPPECWNNFDAILNVTETEYPNMVESTREKDHPGRYYLQLKVAEGKRDRTQLERLLPIALTFLIHHMQHGRRVLVHCAQGKDRSVAVGLAFAALACPQEHPLHLRRDFATWDLNGLVPTKKPIPDGDGTTEAVDSVSGLSRGVLRVLMEDEGGKEIFLEWAHEQLGVSSNIPLANKDILRIVLQLVRQSRENADPTRSTMQKLNRFFMSSPSYLTADSSKKQKV
eukprot:scaffold414_cov109-Cylindrotheca_fusiformis.AAC.12